MDAATLSKAMGNVPGDPSFVGDIFWWEDSSIN